MSWDNVTVPMQSIDTVLNESAMDQLEDEIFFSYDPETTDAERIQDIIDMKYAPADLEQISKECDQLDSEEQKTVIAIVKEI